MKLLNSLIFCAFVCISTILNLCIYFSYHSDCQPNFISNIVQKISESNRTIYFITPTYDRYVQKAELTRISHTLLLVKNIHWILVEDSDHKTELVANLLEDTFKRRIYNEFGFTHLNVATPKDFKTKDSDPNWLKPRGVWQRNVALNWLRNNSFSINPNGVVYFGDDDNTYDLKLFDEIRSTSKVSVFPVGLVGGLLVEKPIVYNDKVVGFNSMWKPTRKYPIDMAGFAVCLKLILSNTAVTFSPNVPRGNQETLILNQLINSIDELEPKAKMCTQILVWHTRTERPKLNEEKKLSVPSNLGLTL